MSKKKKRVGGVQSSFTQTLLLCAIILGLTIFRIFVAISGALNEREALLVACATHPAGGYIEGAAGVPLLLFLKQQLFGAGLFAFRFISPIALLLLTWTVWWVGRKISPYRPSIAFWSALGVNCLPFVNSESLVMDGGIVSASIILLALIAGWNAVDSTDKKGNVFSSWLLFGVIVGIGTLFFYPLGLLIPVAVIARLKSQGLRSIPWKGIILATLLLLLGWIVPLVWNFRHDWIQWSSVAIGFDSISLGSFQVSLGVIVAISAVSVPFLVLFAHAGRWWRRIVFLLFALLLLGSLTILVSPTLIPSALPSPVGVQGIGDLARDIVALRKERPDAKGEKPFLIASIPGLAALLGEKINLSYPELPDAPSVFVAESPSLNSSYSLWPSYADAVTPSVRDNLYTEEKVVSPFFGRNALYMTTESKSELPQTIIGAFAAVALLKEIPLNWNGKQMLISIYQCENYRGLAL